MKIGVDLVSVGTVLLVSVNLGLVVGELCQGALRRLLGGVVVGVGDVGDGHGFRAIVTSDPVGVRTVDSDRSGRIGGSGEGDAVHNLGGNALDVRLAETRINRRIVLEPLRVGAQDLRTGGSR